MSHLAMPDSAASRRICIILDTDWAPEEILEDTAALLDHAAIPATIFITHASDSIMRLATRPFVEIGLHPNFNPCLEGSGASPASAAAILTQFRKLAPTATAIRCHSLTQSSRLLALFRDHGLTHEVNTFIPLERGASLQAWRHPVGIISVPFLWEDDFACSGGAPAPRSPLPALATPGLKVFAFHPVHLFLNTVRLADYETARAAHFCPAALRAARREAGSNGIRDHFHDLIRTAKENNDPFDLISRITPA